MKVGRIRIEGWFKIAGALEILGLVIEIFSLIWHHPLSFFAFALAGASLMGLGILIYLVALVFASPAAEKGNVS